MDSLSYNLGIKDIYIYEKLKFITMNKSKYTIEVKCMPIIFWGTVNFFLREYLTYDGWFFLLTYPVFLLLFYKNFFKDIEYVKNINNHLDCHIVINGDKLEVNLGDVKDELLIINNCSIRRNMKYISIIDKKELKSIIIPRCVFTTRKEENNLIKLIKKGMKCSNT